jgi:MoaA/NifB/PqqE/SkfB family radical SAM enzyme
MDRLRANGYDMDNVCIEEVVGKHSPNWTNESIFERYYNLMEKFKLFRYVWLEKLPGMLMDIYHANPTPLNFYAVAGMLSSVYSDKTMEEEKDICIKRKDFKRVEGYLERPHQATVYMTSNCNFKCGFCYRQHDQVEKAPDFTVALANQLLCRFPTIKGVCICGFGEPLLSPNLVPVLQTLKSANKTVGLITNGSMLTEKLNTLVGWFSPDYISVSLNAHCKELHQKTTGTDTWDKVLDGIRVLTGSKIPCYVSSVMTTENLQYLPQFLRLVRSLGVQTVHLHNLLPHFRDDEDPEFWKLVLTEEHQVHIDEMKKVPDAIVVKKWPTLINRTGGKQTCKFPWYMIGVNGKGSISICNSVYPCSAEKFGSLNDLVVWNSAKLQKFREDFVNKQISACKKCFRNCDWGM